ncbi:MAG: LysR family transcriptional regulator [Alphaproteobacteria bacterium]|nr:LysR family transcriptional regulator [Alphaproteobacteria bacterium]
MNWDDYRYFLAIARARSLTAAGRALGVSQPTVSRRLEAMELRLKVRLFDRTQRGYEMTPAAMDIYETIERVGEDLSDIERKVFGKDLQLTGSLRVTCTEVLLNGYLAPYVWQFLDRHPGIEFGVICSDAQLSLSRRDADLAIRFTGRPPETLVGRRLAKAAFGIYAGRDVAHALLDRSNVQSWDWIGWHDEVYNRMLITNAFPEARIKHRVDSTAAMQSMARHGLGIAVLPCYTADPDPGLRRALPELLSEGTPDLWILHHPDVRGVSRVSLFAEFIADIITADLDLFEGRRLQSLDG